MKTSLRLTLCSIGTKFLSAFVLLAAIATIYFSFGFLGKLPNQGSLIENPGNWTIKVVVAILLLFMIFWTGIVMVYLTSVQLGIKHRVWGIILGWIPIAHLIMLGRIIRIAKNEVRFERGKMKCNELRKSQQVCKTKYPLLMVHGVFFRDFKHFNYWGRIPGELIANGATVFYGNHNSAAAVTDSAKELELRIKQILEETGSEKVNIIAHSKGGLDARTMIALNGMAPHVASLTTINTPHRGCEFADYLLHKIPEKQKQTVARTYNAAATKMGDTNPDFLAAVYDLTFENCKERNEVVKDAPEVFYQSYGSKLNRSVSGQFPLNFTYHLVKYFDGPNDGLVGEESFRWGEHYHFVTTNGKRGISHGDVIDLNKENIPGYDVREFYVQLVADLKKRGY